MANLTVLIQILCAFGSTGPRPVYPNPGWQNSDPRWFTADYNIKTNSSTGKCSRKTFGLWLITIYLQTLITLLKLYAAERISENELLDKIKSSKKEGREMSSFDSIFMSKFMISAKF